MNNSQNTSNRVTERHENAYQWALLIVFSVIGLAAVVVMGFIIYHRPVNDPANARGIITVVYTIGTMAVAVMIVLAVLLTRSNNGDMKEINARFERAKQILTILIGILGVVVGFYFGQATGPGNGAEPQEPANPDAAEAPLDAVDSTPDDENADTPPPLLPQ